MLTLLRRIIALPRRRAATIRAAATTPAPILLLNAPLGHALLNQYPQIPVIWASDHGERHSIEWKAAAGRELTIAEFVKMADAAGWVQIQALMQHPGDGDPRHDSWPAKPGSRESIALHERASKAFRSRLSPHGGWRWHVYTDQETDHATRIPAIKALGIQLGIDWSIHHAANFGSGPDGAHADASGMWMHPPTVNRVAGVITYDWHHNDRDDDKVLAEVEHALAGGYKVVLIFQSESKRDWELAEKLRHRAGLIACIAWFPTHAGGW